MVLNGKIMIWTNLIQSGVVKSDLQLLVIVWSVLKWSERSRKCLENLVIV